MHPILPIMLTFETPHSEENRLNRSRFKSGVVRLERLGLNPQVETLNVRVYPSDAEYEVIESLLKRLRGRPFILPLENYILGSPRYSYSCNEWTWSRGGIRNSWHFEANFKQVRVLNAKP